MKLNYIKAESTVKKSEIEVGVTTVYLRRNFQQAERSARMEGEESELIWTYEEAALTKDEALLYLLEKVTTDSLTS